MGSEGAKPLRVTALTDSGLRCPSCEYNLTGLAEPRCPECGKPIDPKKLYLLQVAEPVPFNLWETSLNRLDGYLLTVWEVLFSPSRFAQSMPGRHDKHAANRFAAVNHIFGGIGPALIVELLIPSLGRSGDPPRVAFFLAAWVAVLFLATLCECAVAMVLTACARPRLPWEKWHYWFGIVRYFSAYLVATLLCAVPIRAMSLAARTSQISGAIVLVTYALPLVSLCLWARALSAAVQAHRDRPIGGIFAFVAALLFGAATCVAALFLTLLGTERLRDSLWPLA